MLRLGHLAGALGTLLLPPLAAAGILTVGPPGGGAQFDEIQDAIDAAADGDVILVQPGTYAGIVVDKPLRILGDGTGVVHVDSALSIGALIRDVPAGKEVVLSGVSVEGTPTFQTENHAVQVASCLGTVVLHDVVVEPAGVQVGVRIDACERVVMSACRVVEAGENGTAAVHATGSTLWIADSLIVGRTAPPALHLLETGADAVRVVDSTLHVWRSTLRGGDGNDASIKGFGAALGGAGVAADGSVVDLFGGPVGAVEGGDGGSNAFFGLNFAGRPGVDLENGSTARIQAALPIQGGFDGLDAVQAPAIQADATSGSTLDPLVFPTLASDTQQAALGTALTLTLEGSPASVQVLFLALRSGPTVTAPGLDGLVFLSLGALIPLATLPIGPSGVRTLPAAVPTSPSFLGKRLYLQSAQVAGGQTSISNPILVTVPR